MPFAVPMVWRKLKDLISNCYFCLTDVSGHMSENKCSVQYPNMLSTLKSVLHTEKLSKPERPGLQNTEDDAEMDSDDGETDVIVTDHYTEYILPNSEKPHLKT
jgi:hypothetical protein